MTACARAPSAARWLWLCCSLLTLCRHPPLALPPTRAPSCANGAQVCVDSTARAAFFHGYNVIVLSDATETSQSDVVQAATLANLELIVGDVMTSAVFEGKLATQELLPLSWRRHNTAATATATNDSVLSSESFLFTK